VTVTVPETEVPPAGATIRTTGGVVSGVTVAKDTGGASVPGIFE
jgi:hypothetical protein